MPDGERVIVAAAPVFDLGIASMHSSPPLEPHPVKSYYYVTDAQADWPAARQDECLEAESVDGGVLGVVAPVAVAQHAHHVQQAVDALGIEPVDLGEVGGADDELIRNRRQRLCSERTAPRP